MRVGSLPCSRCSAAKGATLPHAGRMPTDLDDSTAQDVGGARVLLDTSRGRILATRVEGLLVRGAVQGSRSRRTVADRRSSIADWGRGDRPGRRDWPAGSGRARDRSAAQDDERDPPEDGRRYVR